MSSNKDIAIRVENLSKMYRLGAIGTGTISHDLNVYWHKIRGKGNPYALVGEENDRSTKGESNLVYALKDINFEVKKGEILGIIGKNGAGKSTLLKILSRITGPTEGSIKINGRMASLLEVGTGFHPELTGRENIYLNGAIMGMTKREISSKLDEIVDFSGCARYIDTPVKRYSSGMTVRLGFAVAAFLEPEILVVDEVLAVGDAEFQKKAIGKMQEVSSSEGRTVLFVSHNMASIQRLCTKVVLLKNGRVVESGIPKDVISNYLSTYEGEYSPQFKIPNDEIHMSESIDNIECGLHGTDSVFKTSFNVAESINLEIKFRLKQKISGLRFNLLLLSTSEEVVFFTSSQSKSGEIPEKGEYSLNCEIPKNLLNAQEYYITLNAGVPGVQLIFLKEKCFKILINGMPKVGSEFNSSIPGIIAPDLKWKLNR